MIKNYPVLNPSIAKRQSGVVLIISLIMLLALTLIGVTSSSVTGLEEKMAANSKDINLAFQAAEAALRDAEASLKNDPSSMIDRAATNANQGVGGYYTLLNNDETTNPPQDPTLKDPQPQPAFYNSVDWYGTKVITYNNTGSSGNKLAGLYRAPEYIIEEISSTGLSSASSSGGSLGGGSDYSQSPVTGKVIIYRITAHGWGSNANSVVTVQSIAKVTY